MIAPLPAIEERNYHSGSVKEVLLAVHEGGYSPLCEDLCEVPNESSLIPEASRALATIAYSARAMA